MASSRNWKEAAMSKTDFERTLEILEVDLDALGWDQPARFYSLKGTPSDPELELLGVLPGHPFETLEQIRRAGYRAPSEVVGLAIANEAWIPITLDLAVERNLVQKPPEDVEITVDHRMAWTKALMNSSPDGSIAGLPDQYRREVRIVTAITRDGVVHMYTKHRDDNTTVTYSDSQATGRMIHVMQDLLGLPRSPDINLADA
jgi:hypothetical protein